MRSERELNDEDNYKHSKKYERPQVSWIIAGVNDRYSAGGGLRKRQQARIEIRTKSRPQKKQPGNNCQCGKSQGHSLHRQIIQARWIKCKSQSEQEPEYEQVPKTCRKTINHPPCSWVRRAGAYYQ